MIVGDPEQRARAFIEFCDGLEEAGLVDYARRGRLLARDVLELAGMLEAERSARRQFQERAERLQAIVGKAAYEHLRGAA